MTQMAYGDSVYVSVRFVAMGSVNYSTCSISAVHRLCNSNQIVPSLIGRFYFEKDCKWLEHK